MLGTVGVGLGAVGAEGVGLGASSALPHAMTPSKVSAISAPLNLLTIVVYRMDLPPTIPKHILDIHTNPTPLTIMGKWSLETLCLVLE